MDQKTYDEKMQALNKACHEECEQYHEQLFKIGRDQSEVKRNILSLKARSMELGIEYQDVCEKIRETKKKYNEQKALLYAERPQPCETAE